MPSSATAAAATAAAVRQRSSNKMSLPIFELGQMTVALLHLSSATSQRDECSISRVLRT